MAPDKFYLDMAIIDRTAPTDDAGWRAFVLDRYEIVRRAVTEMFRERGELRMHYIAIAGKREIALLTLLPLSPDKNIISAMVTKIAGFGDVHAIISVSEIWKVVGLPQIEARNIYDSYKTLGDHPQRTECVQLGLETRFADLSVQLEHAEILRPAEGPPTLGAFVAFDAPNLEGRMLGFFARARPAHTEA